MAVIAELSEDRDIVLISEYQDKDYVKMLPGARWDPENKVWRAPLSWSTCKALRGIFQAKLTIGPRLGEWAWNLRKDFIEPQMKLRLAMDDDEFGSFESRLFDFQRPGAKFVAFGERVLLCDDMGSGKTVQLATALHWWDEKNGDAYPVLIIAPRSTKGMWERELKKWVPGARPVSLKGSATARKKILEAVKSGEVNVVIAHWEQLRIHSRLAGYGSMRLEEKDKTPKEFNEIPWRAVVADEAHRAKNPQSQQTRALWAVGLQPSVRYRVGMTGTPVANAPHDMWAPLHFIDAKEFPAKTRFIDRYCMSSWNSFGGLDVIGLKPETSEEFYAVVDPRMRRIPKALSLGHLPPLIGAILSDQGPNIRPVEMDSKQSKAYDDMEASMVAKLENGDLIFVTNPIAQLTRLMQFASSYAELNDEGEVRLVAPSNKVDALLDVIDETAAEDHVVVFAQSAQLIRLAVAALEKAGISTRLIIGGQKEDERQANIDDFQAGKAKVMLATIAAGGVGVTLTRARVCIFMQRSFSMIDNTQAEARVHRIGSEVHESVEIIDLISEGTVDERVIEVLRTKGERLEEIVRDKDTLKQLLGGDRRPKPRATKRAKTTEVSP